MSEYVQVPSPSGKSAVWSPAANWLIPVALLLLSAVPVVAGSLRLAEMVGGLPVLPDGDRVRSAPVALVAHIVSVTVFSVLGAFQFAPRLRRRRRGWHRIAGRLVVLCGLLTALTGLWLTLFLPRGAADGDVLVAIRVVVSVAMAACVCLGFVAVRRRDVAAHRSWMIRGYAIGMGAGTQFFTQMAWLAAVGPVTTVGKTSTLTAGWLINIVVAEWIIRHRATGSGRQRGAGRVSRSAPPRPAG
ncbi:DUF2306 domain-containing protein [Micromonospora sp. NBC_01813]|uniref:DUF2306 domain-containing protein n=1 Tax=Micromonospora sp. NBC_01813 TaxID=2975988 RepID=UPI002DDBBC18|nr:DUF2306 domain-containing protein [Micromonospora sp. NBC_01813]WSA10662.1 DUF2306 domain-containing protein [Micromonospora sp. NBC_01813]